MVGVPSIEALRALAPPNTAELVTLLGFYAPCDGASGQFWWDAACPRPDDTGLHVKPNGVDPADPGRWRRLVNGVWNVTWFGARGDGVHRAVGEEVYFRAAIDAMAPAMSMSQSTGCVLEVPPGTYCMLQTLDINRCMRLRGQTGGHDYQSVELRWDWAERGTTMIRMCKANAFPNWTEWGNGAVLDSLRLVGPGYDTSVPLSEVDPDCGTDQRAGGHGVLMEVVSSLVETTVENATGNGIFVCGDTNSDQTSNASRWKVDGGEIRGNGGHGIATQCADSNVGWCRASFTNNRGWGVYERSQHGNTYEACHVNANALGGYNSANAGAINNSNFVGCYAEDNQQNAFHGGTNIIGGLMSYATGGNRIGPSGGSAASLVANLSADKGPLEVHGRQGNTRPLVSVRYNNHTHLDVAWNGRVRIGKQLQPAWDDKLGSTLDHVTIAGFPNNQHDATTQGTGIRFVHDGWWAGQVRGRFPAVASARYHGELVLETPSDASGTEKPSLILSRGTARWAPYADAAAIGAIPEPIAGMCVWNEAAEMLWIYRASSGWGPL